MCEFLSWLEYKDKLFYLTNYEMNTRQGKELKIKVGSNYYDEITGHGAIKEYFGLPHSKCKDYECTDFSSPYNFPSEIVEKIKEGQFSGIGIDIDLLRQSAWAEYEKIRQSAWAEYEKIRQPALAEYEKIRQSAWAWADEYEKIRQSAWAEYEKIRLKKFWHIFDDVKNRNEAWK